LLTLDKLRLRLKLRLPDQLLRLLSPKDLLILLHLLMQLSPDSLLSFWLEKIQLLLVSKLTDLHGKQL
jgi:hypothetical protein